MVGLLSFQLLMFLRIQQVCSECFMELFGKLTYVNILFALCKLCFYLKLKVWGLFSRRKHFALMHVGCYHLRRIHHNDRGLLLIGSRACSIHTQGTCRVCLRTAHSSQMAFFCISQ